MQELKDFSTHRVFLDNKRMSFGNQEKTRKVLQNDMIVNI